MNPLEVFHNHLDVCKRCMENPFDLCVVGDVLIVNAGEYARLVLILEKSKN